jgi:hypothetical protein
VNRLSSRFSFVIVVALLLLAAGLRLWNLTTLPAGFSDDELIEISIIESVQAGNISVFHDLGDEGREGLYHTVQAVMTPVVGKGTIGFRILSVWANLVTLSIVYAIARRLYGRVAGIGALALLAVTFWPVLLSRHISREAIVPFLVSIVLLLTIMLLPVYRRRRRSGDNTSISAMLGFFLGVSLYVHPVGLLLVLFVVAFILYMIVSQQRMSRRRISYLTFAILVLIIISMPYLISSIRTPQLGGMERITGDRFHFSADAVVDALSGLVFQGDDDPLANLPGRPLFDLLSVLIMLAGLVVAVQRRSIPRYTLVLLALLIFAPIFLLAANTPDFENMNASLPVLALLFGLGLSMTSNWLSRDRSWQVALALVSVIVVFNLVLTSRDLFGQWPENEAVRTVYNARIGALAHYADLTSDDIPTVICGWNMNRSAGSATQRIVLMMNRKNGNVRYVDCTSALIMANGGETQQILLPDENTLANTHPEIRFWLERATPIDNDRIVPGSAVTLNVEGQLADRIGVFTVTTPVNFAPELGASSQRVIAPPVSFSNNLTFLGYIADADLRYHPGEVFSLITYWRIQNGVVPADLRLFTHILSDPGARPPANTDAIHLEPNLLRNRDVIVEVTRVPLPASLPPGRYLVSIGAYQDQSDIRLNVLEDGQPQGTRLFLFSITVEAQP